MKVDYKILQRECKKLKIYPNEWLDENEQPIVDETTGEIVKVFNPFTIPFNSAEYFILLSIRGTGKTTGMLLMGMVAFTKFRTRIEYIRNKHEMVGKSKLRSLFDTIIKCDYISKITNGRYNNVSYTNGNYYHFCNTNEHGKVMDVCPEPFMHTTSLEDSFTLKSTYSSPTSDIVIFDEFIDNSYYNDNLFYLCDILSTYFRKREGCKVFMLANTINAQSQWFSRSEMDIMFDISKMKTGETKLITTDKGTRLCIDIIAEKMSMKKIVLNKLYFGFNNPKLNAITGSDDWAYCNYPRLVSKDFEVVANDIYLKTSDFYLKLQLINHNTHGLCVYLSEWYGNVFSDELVFCDSTPQAKNEVYPTNTDIPIAKLIFRKLFVQHKIYYNSNNAGLTADTFFHNVGLR